MILLRRRRATQNQKCPVAIGTAIMARDQLRQKSRLEPLLKYRLTDATLDWEYIDLL
jgi:hypothetical protein